MPTMTMLSRWKRPHITARSGRDRDRGQAAVEFVGVISLLLVVALAAIQLGIAGYAMQQAGTASRAAARAATYRESTVTADQAGRAALSDWLAGRSGFTVVPGAQQVKVTARVPIPSVLPLFDLPDARRSTVMPLD